MGHHILYVVLMGIYSFGKMGYNTLLLIGLRHFFVGINGFIKQISVEDILLKVLYEDSPAFHLTYPFLSGKRI
jgi:hypothetical protein